MSTNITVAGNVVKDQPRLNYTSDGTAAANFTVADNSDHYDDQAGEWKRSSTTFWSVEAFGKLAEHIADQVQKGQRVVVVGRTRTREWTDPEGGKRRQLRINASDVAVSLKFATKADQSDQVEPAEQAGQR